MKKIVILSLIANKGGHLFCYVPGSSEAGQRVCANVSFNGLSRMPGKLAKNDFIKVTYDDAKVTKKVIVDDFNGQDLVIVNYQYVFSITKV